MEEEKDDKRKKLMKEGTIKEWWVKVNLFTGLIKT
jgi:hypothetical protein